LGLGDQQNRRYPTLVILKNIIQISSGYYFSMALNSTGNVFSFGSNEQGQLGLGDQYNRYTPHHVNISDFIVEISCGGYHVLYLSKSGKIYSNGYGSVNSYLKL
jgi:alpha-tubulin suppressor-like RCC1 family protein